MTTKVLYVQFRLSVVRERKRELDFDITQIEIQASKKAGRNSSKMRWKQLNRWDAVFYRTMHHPGEPKVASKIDSRKFGDALQRESGCVE